MANSADPDQLASVGFFKPTDLDLQFAKAGISGFKIKK